MRGLYIHIPFCQYICNYCDFVKQVPKNDEMVEKYLDNLIKEIKQYEDRFSTIETIYIGGGTPSMLTPSQMERLFLAISPINASEVTIEVNPDSYSLDKGLMMKKYGINRVSLGVQSFNDEILNYVGRKHSKEMVYYTVNSLKTLGINNISIDLIYAIPNQTIEMLENDLKEVKNLSINHVSCYSLILEEKTYFYHQFLEGKFTPVDNEIEGKMFEIVMDRLKEYGFEHYEISNFAKNQMYSKHNKLYWTLQDYIGVGLGAHGFLDNVRTYNHKSLNKYNDNPRALEVVQTKKDNIQDYLIFGLRLIDGINIDDFNQKFEVDLLELFPEIKTKINESLLKVNNGNLMLTEKGIFFGNQVFEVFV